MVKRTAELKISIVWRLVASGDGGQKEMKLLHFGAGMVEEFRLPVVSVRASRLGLYSSLRQKHNPVTTCDTVPDTV